MEINRDQLDHAKSCLTGMHDFAPHPVVGAMLALESDPAQVVASACESASVKGQTVWRALWVTTTHLIHCAAATDGDEWSFSEPAEEDRIEIRAWRAPLSEVAITVDRARMTNQRSMAWQVDVAVVLHVENRDPVTLPLRGGLPRLADRKSHEAVLSAILN